jgi:23S rRNA pseudouridine1911/1915/1917 synthase
VARPADHGQRLDKVLAAHIPSMSRARLQALIRDGRTAVGGRVATDPKTAVREGDELIVDIPEAKPSTLEGEAIPLDILYEDDSLLVIDKPAGLAVHPGAGHATGTLVHALIAHCGESLSGIGGVQRPGIVHRLDKDTSGVMVVAKTDRAHRGLAAQFADHGRSGDLRREYLALVWGEPHPRVGRIETQLARHPASRVKMAVVQSGGRHAITHYAVEAEFADPDSLRDRKRTMKTGNRPLMSLVRCRLETGRTHQVRVHLAFKGTPLIGDPLYGQGQSSRIRALPERAKGAIMTLNRQALHAAVLAFRHPVTGRMMTFERGIPKDMRVIVSALETLV